MTRRRHHSTLPSSNPSMTLRFVRQNDGAIHAAVMVKHTLCGLGNPAWRRNPETGERERIPVPERMWRILRFADDVDVSCGNCQAIIDAICDEYAADDEL